jgi:hypothetical protein
MRWRIGQLLPVPYDLKNFSHVGALTMKRTRFEFFPPQAVIWALLGTFETLFVDWARGKTFEFPRFDCQSRFTSRFRVVEEEQPGFEILEIRLITDDGYSWIGEKCLPIQPDLVTHGARFKQGAPVGFFLSSER